MAEVFKGTRIDAIKKIREVTNLSLLYESKQVVDALFPKPFSDGNYKDLVRLLHRFSTALDVLSFVSDDDREAIKTAIAVIDFHSS